MTLGRTKPMHLNTTDFEFRLLSEADLPMLREWLLRPHVAQWWGPAESIEELREEYLAVTGQPGATRACIAWSAGQPVGFIQCYVVKDSGDGWWEDETDPGARGIDQFLADENRLNAGLGRAMIRAFVQMIFADPSVTVIQTDPSPKNVRAIRCYMAAGFSPIDEVVTPDGPALLMKCARPETSGTL
jgi:RimJ/RimL family protein N-acetyltransferase